MHAIAFFHKQKMARFSETHQEEKRLQMLHPPGPGGLGGRGAKPGPGPAPGPILKKFVSFFLS